MGSVAKKRRRPQSGLTFYDDDDDSMPRRRTTDSPHLHTSITATSKGFSTRTTRIIAADPRSNKTSNNAPSVLANDDGLEFHLAGNTNKVLTFEEDDNDEIFETLYPESFSDIHEYIDARKIRKRTNSVSGYLPIAHFLYKSCVFVGLPVTRLGKELC